VPSRKRKRAACSMHCAPPASTASICRRPTSCRRGSSRMRSACAQRRRCPRRRSARCRPRSPIAASSPTRRPRRSSPCHGAPDDGARRMFGLLRRAKPVLLAPLLELRWDGRELRATCTPGALADIALDLDGCYFTSVAVDAEGRAHCAFPFAPSGTDAVELLLRAGRDGAALVAGPLRLHFGRPGLATASAGARRASLAPLAASCLVPFGRDVCAREVVVVVPVHDAPELVERCLAALRAHLDAATRVIVIDDAS